MWTAKWNLVSRPAALKPNSGISVKALVAPPIGTGISALIRSGDVADTTSVLFIRREIFGLRLGGRRYLQLITLYFALDHGCAAAPSGAEVMGGWAGGRTGSVLQSKATTCVPSWV